MPQPPSSKSKSAPLPKYALDALSLYVRWENMCIPPDEKPSTTQDYLPYTWMIVDAVKKQGLFIMGSGPGDEGGPRYLTVYLDVEDHRVRHIDVDFEGVFPIYDDSDYTKPRFLLMGKKSDWKDHNQTPDPTIPLHYLQERS